MSVFKRLVVQKEKNQHVVTNRTTSFDLSPEASAEQTDIEDYVGSVIPMTMHDGKWYVVGANNEIIGITLPTKDIFDE